MISLNIMFRILRHPKVRREIASVKDGKQVIEVLENRSPRTIIDVRFGKWSKCWIIGGYDFDKKEYWEKREKNSTKKEAGDSIRVEEQHSKDT